MQWQCMGRVMEVLFAIWSFGIKSFLEKNYDDIFSFGDARRLTMIVMTLLQVLVSSVTEFPFYDNGKFVNS